MECIAHIPHKEWADDDRERDNYATIEQWSRVLHDAWLDGWMGGTVYIQLLIPAKGWSGAKDELENYLAIERWSRYFQLHCTKVIPTPCGC